VENKIKAKKEGSNMKGKLALSILLVAVLALVGTGCDKVTGGGQFTDEWTGHKITFGFNAKPLDPLNEDAGYPFIKAKGQFQMVDHGTKTRIHGTFDGTYIEPSEEASWFSGRCSVNGEGDVYFEITATDLGKPGLGAGDHIFIMVGEFGDPDLLTYEGVLNGGNIQGHKAKKVK